MFEVVSIQFREKMKYKKSDIIDLTVQNSQETNVVLPVERYTKKQH